MASFNNNRDIFMIYDELYSLNKSGLISDIKFNIILNSGYNKSDIEKTIETAKANINNTDYIEQIRSENLSFNSGRILRNEPYDYSLSNRNSDYSNINVQVSDIECEQDNDMDF
jgi:hypothetical protein